MAVFAQTVKRQGQRGPKQGAAARVLVGWIMGAEG